MTTKVFDRKTIALALQSALLITTSCKCAFKQTQPGNNGLEARRLTLAAIAEGTTEGEVLHNLGNPDEVRQRESPSIADEAYRWAYGVRSKGEFANIGMVIFATNKTVLKAYCPTKPRYYRNPADVPIRSIPERTKTGRFCVIESWKPLTLHRTRRRQGCSWSIHSVIH